MCAKAYDKKAHDVGFLRADGTTKVGMMLVKDKNNIPAYSVFDRRNLADQFFTGVPGQQYVNPEEELPLIQNDWRSGLGLEVYDSADPKRYRTGNMDMRFKGMGIAGTIASTVTKPTITNPTIVNADCELTTGWTNGSRSSAYAHGGTYSWQVGTTEAYQDLDNWVVGQAYTFEMWVRHNTGSTTYKIGIDDGITTTYSTTTSSLTFEQKTVTHTIGTGATRLRLLLFVTVGSGDYAYFDDATITNPTLSNGVSVCAADFNDAHYVSFGYTLGKLNGTGTAFTFVRVLPAPVTDLEVMTISGTEYLFIAVGTSELYWYMTTAEAFTQSTAAVNKFKYFKRVDAATPVMWGSDGNATLRSTVNPLNGGTAWSGQTTVDAASNVITGLFSDAGSLYINKEDMPYYLDSTGAVKSDLAPILATLPRSTDNGKSANYWLGNFYLPWGYSLLEENAGTLTWRSPNDYSTQLADFAGQVFAVAGDDRYLFTIVDNSNKIEVLASRLESIDGTTRWVLHCINETTLTGCETCWVSSVYQKRLWISSTSSSESLYYIPLPLAYGNVLADANRAFLTGTIMETSWLHGEFRSELKSFIKLTLEMGHTYDADIYFTVKYKLLEDTAWTTIGNFTGSATSMIQSRYIPNDSESNKPTSTLFKLQFTAVTDDTTKTPVLLNYNLKAVLYPTKGSIIAMKVRCSHKQIRMRDGNLEDGSDLAVIATLDEARTSTYPITMYDWNGDTQTVKLLSLPSGVPYWQVATNEVDGTNEREYNILAEVIPVS